MALPGKAERVEAIGLLLREGVVKDEIIGRLEFGREYDSLDSLWWDVDDAVKIYEDEKAAIAAEMEALEALKSDEPTYDDWDKDRHIREREELLVRAKNMGMLSVAVQCLQEIAKIQNLYKEVERKDSTIELIWTFDDNGSGDRKKIREETYGKNNGELSGGGILPKAVLLPGEGEGESDPA